MSGFSTDRSFHKHQTRGIPLRVWASPQTHGALFTSDNKFTSGYRYPGEALRSPWPSQQTWLPDLRG